MVQRLLPRVWRSPHSDTDLRAPNPDALLHSAHPSSIASHRRSFRSSLLMLDGNRSGKTTTRHQEHPFQWCASWTLQNTYQGFPILRDKQHDKDHPIDEAFVQFYFRTADPPNPTW